MNFTNTPLLTQEDNGTIRVTGHRITLETLVFHIQKGRSARWIRTSFPSLSIPEISGVIAWYRDHVAEADEYLRVSQEEEDRILRELDQDPRNMALRKKLQQCKAEWMARKRSKSHVK